jgi:UDP-N-acetylglucosamine:LPS N-acetylglucosamine transferase
MPFLNISSGHHQVADALMETLKRLHPAASCEKIDLLRHTFGFVGSLVCLVYVKWFHLHPSSYSWIYRRMAFRTSSDETGKRYRLYEVLFLRAVSRLLKQRRPDFIVCTHSLPSYMLNRLKQLKLLSVPVMNAYTDYFINDLWGIRFIDFHLVPDGSIKKWLLERGVAEDRIYVTGIPLHPDLKKAERIGGKRNRETRNVRWNVLLAGGSLGAGTMKSFLRKTGSSGNVHYHVLCGKNKKLYRRLVRGELPHVTPLPYISCRAEMDRLYEEMDAIVTKPGGVTMSESLWKAIPVFVYDALPGQEEINLRHLREQGLAVSMESWKQEECDPEERLLSLLEQQEAMDALYCRIGGYHRDIAEYELSSTLQAILQYAEMLK